MPLIRRAWTRIEHDFDVSGVDPLPIAHNPAEMFLPKHAKVIFRDGAFDQMHIDGPKIARNGKALRTYAGTTFDDSFMDPGPDFCIPSGGEMPEWAKDLVRDVAAVPNAEPQQIGISS